MSPVKTGGNSGLFCDDLRQKERVEEGDDSTLTAIANRLSQLRLGKGFVHRA